MTRPKASDQGTGLAYRRKKNAPKFFPDRPSGVKISVARVHFFSKPLSMHIDKENTVSDAVLNKNLLLKARFFFVSKSTRFD